MTTTALRALTVAALSAAVLFSAAPAALADTASTCSPDAPVSTPECPNPWPDTTNVTVCMTDPKLCELPVTEPAPVPVVDTPATSTAPTAAAPSAPSARNAPSAPTFQAPLADGHVQTDSVGTATATVASPTPFWVLLDKVMEMLKAALAPLTGLR